MKTTTNISYAAFALFALACFALSPQARAVCQEGRGSDVSNTFLGEDALLNNLGAWNTAVGFNALINNTTGSFNTATGAGALGGFNFNGSSNTATGFGALLYNSNGNNNTAIGVHALVVNATGSDNTAVGHSALGGNYTGNNNIALGRQAGYRCKGGANNNIMIGNHGRDHDSGTIRIGDPATQSATYMAGISGAIVAEGVGVIIDSDGHLGTVLSSDRYKEKIKAMDKASEAILALQPVTFRYKHDLDPKGIPQFGLVAQEVEKVNPDLVARDDKGKPYAVRYEAVNAMLLNEFLKEHRKVEEQQATITELKSTVAQQEMDFQAIAAHQQKQIEALTTGLQKVSAHLELSKAAPQTVLTNR